MALKFWRQQSIYEHKGAEAKCSEVLIEEKLFLNQVEQQSSVTRIQCARAFQTPLSFSSISFIVILMTLQHQPVIISTLSATPLHSAYSISRQNLKELRHSHDLRRAESISLSTAHVISTYREQCCMQQLRGRSAYMVCQWINTTELLHQNTADSTFSKALQQPLDSPLWLKTNQKQQTCAVPQEQISLHLQSDTQLAEVTHPGCKALVWSLLQTQSLTCEICIHCPSYPTKLLLTPRFGSEIGLKKAAQSHRWGGKRNSTVKKAHLSSDTGHSFPLFHAVQQKACSALRLTNINPTGIVE